MATPTDVLHDKRHNMLRIVWDDGAVAEYAIDYLRGWCPCAGCQGHGRAIRFHQRPEIRAEAIAEVGSYALAFRFSDGHDTGIYTWTWLRRLADEGRERGSFSDGAFRPPADDENR